jgi:hypothetical protein
MSDAGTVRSGSLYDEDSDEESTAVSGSLYDEDSDEESTAVSGSLYAEDSDDVADADGADGSPAAATAASPPAAATAGAHPPMGWQRADREGFLRSEAACQARGEPDHNTVGGKYVMTRPPTHPHCTRRERAPRPAAAAAPPPPPPPPPPPVSCAWNERLQEIVEDPELSAPVRLERTSQLRAEFVQQQRRVLSAIVGELALPDERKTIKPLDAGGAFGAKYLVDGVFFKFALAAGGGGSEYGGDGATMKAAGNEVKAFAALLERGGAGDDFAVRVPLCAVFDYFGFRVVASGAVPIDGRRTLRVGTMDGCRTLAADAASVAALAPLAGRMNLKPHHVTPAQGSGAELCMGADVELHRGDDGRLYMVDSARVLPPLCPSSSPKLTSDSGTSCAALLLPAAVGAAPRWVQLSRPPKLASRGRAPAAFTAATVECAAAALGTPPAGAPGVQEWTSPGVALAVFYTATGERNAEALRLVRALGRSSGSHGSATVLRALGELVGELSGDALVTLTLGWQEHLTRQMRPELLARASSPVNPDCFVPRRVCPGVRRDNEDVVALTRSLLSDAVPAAAAELDALAGDCAAPEKLVAATMAPRSVKELLHKRGINLRFLGCVRAACRAGGAARDVLLAHMVARTAAYELGVELRAARMADVNGVVHAYVNLLCHGIAGPGTAAVEDHRLFLKLLCCDKYAGGLALAELNDAPCLWSMLPQPMRVAALEQLQGLAGIKLFPEVGDREGAEKALAAPLDPGMKMMIAFMPNYKVASVLFAQGGGRDGGGGGGGGVEELTAQLHAMLRGPDGPQPALGVLRHLRKLVVAEMRAGGEGSAGNVDTHAVGAAVFVSRAQQTCVLGMIDSASQADHIQALWALRQCEDEAMALWELLNSKYGDDERRARFARLDAAVEHCTRKRDLLEYGAARISTERPKHPSGRECFDNVLFGAMDDAQWHLEVCGDGCGNLIMDPLKELMPALEDLLDTSRKVSGGH